MMPPSAREEGHVERDAPEPREGHRTLPLGAFTRFGCWAMYVDGVLHHDLRSVERGRASTS